MNTGLQIALTLFLGLIRFSRTAHGGREFQGSRLVHAGHVSDSAPALKSFYTAGVLQCAHRCLAQAKCVSFDYKSTALGKGLCRLHRNSTKSRLVPAAEASFLQHDSEHIFVQKFITEPQSCLDHYVTGARNSGTFAIYDSEGEHYKVFCDMTSEANSVWTLVMSQSYRNRDKQELKDGGLLENKPLNAEEPNWPAYRLSLRQMTDLQSQATHWRITCSFPSCGVDYRDYVRAKFSQFDPLSFEKADECMRVEYINVRGHNCTDCTALWTQSTWKMLHHRSDIEQCDLGKTHDSIGNEQCFGYYNDPKQPLFRCTANDTSSTNHWFGAYV